MNNLPTGCTLNEIDAAWGDEETTDLQLEIDAATCVVRACPERDPDARAYAVLGALAAMLNGMAGQGPYVTHAPCFDAATTKALRDLLEAIG